MPFRAGSLKIIARTVESLFWPPHCALCYNRTNNDPVCSSCMQDSSLDCSRRCPICGEDIGNNSLCSNHPKAAYPFYMSIFSFDGVIRELIHMLKYAGRKDIGRFLGYYMVSAIEWDSITTSADCLVPVPLHSSKKRDRGFNQSDVIGGAIAKALGLPLVSNAVKRVRMTESQTKMENAEARKSNMAGAFVSSSELSGRNVVIIDDVITTGATTYELAKSIDIAGGNVICAVSIAHPALDDSVECQV